MRIRRGVSARVSTWLQYKLLFNMPSWIFIAVICLLIGLTSVLIFRSMSRAAPPCPCTIFTAEQPAVQPNLFSEPGGIELGVKMRFEYDGYITGVRFYKTPGMGGIHSASLWNSTGTVRMANATFVNESASGWQEVQFAPVAVMANAIYTASVFMTDGNYTATGNYFTAQINNSPFIIQRHGEAWDGTGNPGQGSYAGSSTSVYPNGSFNATNYWIDATYVSSPDISAPTITTQAPAAGAVDVAVTDAITATFDKRLNPESVSLSTVLVTDEQQQLVPGAVSYDTATSKVQFSPDELWETGKTYTITLKGSSPEIQDFDGHDLAADYSWSFTASTTPLNCPCSLQQKQIPTGSTTYREAAPDGLELGLKIVPRMNGYITALRFYKPIVTAGASRTAHVWDAQGNLLATTTTSESDYGWQEVALPSPLHVNRDELYIVSFGFATGEYQATFNQFTSPLTSPGFAAYPSGDSRNNALGSGLTNSVYASSAGSYPSSPSANNAYYYIDALFAAEAQDSTPLDIVSAEPANGSYAVKRSTPIRLVFDQAINPATVTAANVQLRDENGQLVPRTVGFDQATRAVTITPSAPLDADTRYDVMVTSAVGDVRGVHMSQDYNWSFTTGVTTSAVDMNQGGGGPVLIVTAPNDTYGKYYAEILRTEGISYFSVKDTSELSPSLLDQYITTIVVQTSLTQPQIDTLRAWVEDGGNLIAMRPDKKLASLLGVTDVGVASPNQYLRVDPATAMGAGIVSEPMQFKGVADHYALNGATAVAQLYSDAMTATTFPAVTTRVVGQGTASAFSYDLARSVIALHQGNQAWAGQDRNGDGVVRSNDLFYGAKLGDAQPDWLDADKMAIPQADEQQRLLVNIMTEVTKEQLPMPRFWYLPDDHKAALVLAGDDHNLNDYEGTRQAMNNWLNQSPIGCSVAAWQCVRAGHYVYTGSALTNTQAVQLAGYGFEVASHPSDNGQCSNDASYAELYSKYAADMAAWGAKYVGLMQPVSSRYHCYSWADWDMMPRADQALGVRYDLNTVAYPASWVNSRSPMVTGSGMNMRLTDTSGALLDVHQGVTNFDNTTADTTAIAAMLDNAIGPSGYYGLFGSHYDMAPNDTYHQQLVDIATSRGVPVISAAQALQWLTSREQSSFENLSRPAVGHMTFRVAASEGAQGLRAMVPLQDGGSTMTSLSRGGQSVSYQTQTIKGVSYGVFEARTGDYEVRYSDYGQPVVRQPSENGTSPLMASSSLAARQMATATVDGDNASIDNRPEGSIRSGGGGSTRNTNSPPLSAPSENAPWYQSPAAIATTASVAALSVAGTGGWLFLARRRKNNGNF